MSVGTTFGDPNELLELNVLSLSPKSTCFPACESDLKNLSELLKLAALGMSVGACGVATTVSMGAMAIPCTLALVGTLRVITEPPAWMDNIDNAGTILDGAGCLEADVSGCLGVGITLATGALDIATAEVNNNSSLIFTANTALSDPDVDSGVLQGTEPTNSCTSYECDPNNATPIPCLNGGTKTCESDCHYGACTTTDDEDTSCDNDGNCEVGESEASCPADCEGGVDNCCVTYNDCPGETGTECGVGCCCCGYGSVCSQDGSHICVSASVSVR